MTKTKDGEDKKGIRNGPVLHFINLELHDIALFFLAAVYRSFSRSKFEL